MLTALRSSPTRSPAAAGPDLRHDLFIPSSDARRGSRIVCPLVRGGVGCEMPCPKNDGGLVRTSRTVRSASRWSRAGRPAEIARDLDVHEARCENWVNKERDSAEARHVRVDAARITHSCEHAAVGWDGSTELHADIRRRDCSTGWNCRLEGATERSVGKKRRHASFDEAGWRGQPSVRRHRELTAASGRDGWHLSEEMIRGRNRKLSRDELLHNLEPAPRLEDFPRRGSRRRPAVGMAASSRRPLEEQPECRRVGARCSDRARRSRSAMCRVRSVGHRDPSRRPL